MNFFPRRQQRKIHPCSLFKRKSSSNDDFHRRRNTNSNVSENQNLKKMPIEDRTLNTPLISGEMLFAKKLKELGLLKEHRCKYIDGI